MFMTLFGAIVALVAQPQEPARVPQPTGEPGVFRVADDITEIREKSLRGDGGFKMGEGGGNAVRMVGGTEGRGPTGDGASWAPGRPGNLSDNTQDRPEASCIYVIRLKPGEHIQADLKCEEHGKVFMQWASGTKVTVMTSQIRRANMAPRSMRASGIALKNLGSEPMEAGLVLLGSPNYAYTLKLTRTQK